MHFVVLTAAILTLSAAANAALAQDAIKICTERYNTEKAGGTIPVGMSKSKYMSQCTGSMRRAAKLEQELAQGASAGDSANTGNNAGSNEVTAATTPAKPVPTTNKPSRIQTTVSLTPKGS